VRLVTIINVTNARKKFYQLISDVNTNCEPITIMNDRGKNAVLISEDEWKAIQETIYLNSIPGLTVPIISSEKDEIDDCTLYNEDEEW